MSGTTKEAREEIMRRYSGPQAGPGQHEMSALLRECRHLVSTT